ncbi:PREDICTED: tubulin polyglutamylase complex subunit 2 [Nicrophorus vespilloides]|uniref:Tubulin polyglutamylase complex subunit 2 n=1 Tax=Nicrophorus vespilloides TaxID=110193 RepID=A0ABM1NGL0_NICVS|nr:PREDICTED: tubulin polyglutamylase complex subunit 2 [Nicrophorus vespilloides]
MIILFEIMDFVVDKVSEDSFFVNLLLGLPKQLEKFEKLGVKSTYLSRRQPISHGDICAWEHKQGILLPEDLRNFYTSIDGFLFSWTFSFKMDKCITTGKIEINQLQDLVQIIGHEATQDPGVSTVGERFELKLGNSSKLFELVTINLDNKVVLVYLNSRYSPTIWLSTGPNEYYFLADDFTTYFRMAIAHLGIPKWQLLFTPEGIPQSIENMIRFLAPDLLKDKRTTEWNRQDKERKIKCEFSDKPVNKVDVSIFKCLPKICQGIPRVVEKEKVKSPKKKLERERSFNKPQRKPLYYIRKPT